MIGEECVLEFFQGLKSQGQGLDPQGRGKGLNHLGHGQGLHLQGNGEQD